MIEVKVPMDIRSYDLRVAGSLTMRQLGLLILAFGLDLVLYDWVLKPLKVPTEALIYIIMFLDVPILAFSHKPIGQMRMEQYLKRVITNNFIAPTERKMWNRVPRKALQQNVTRKTSAKKQKKLKQACKKHPEYRAYS